VRQLLRELPVFEGVAEDGLAVEDLPANPLRALREWLLRAVEAGEREPHAMTLATVSADGRPSSRVLLCKDLDDSAVYFATSARSRKGTEIAETGQAAACFYWCGQGRQVRLTGPVVRQPAPAGADDFNARSRASKLAALLEPQPGVASAAQLADAARRLAQRYPADIPAPPDWAVYAIQPTEVELWQGRRDRLHARVRYDRGTDGWRRRLLWP